ncbi:MAG: hypothetical protein ACREUK_11320 [Burkholderiales bacterium]
MRFSHVLLAATAAACLSVHALAQLRLEPPPPVPAPIREPQRGALMRTHDALESRKTAAEKGVASLNAECSHVDSSDAARVAGCRGRNQDLRQAIAAYRRDLAAYKSAAYTCALAKPSIDAFKAEITDTQAAIRRLGLATTVGAYEQLQDMSQQQLDDLNGELRDAILSSALSVGTDAIKEGLIQAGSIGTGQAERLATKAEKLGITNPDVHDAILALGHVQGKPEMARNAKYVIDQLRQLTEASYETYKIDHSKSGGEFLWGVAGFTMVFVRDVAPDAAKELAKRMPVLAVGAAGKIGVEPGLAVAPAVATFIQDMRLVGYTRDAVAKLDVATAGELEAIDRLHKRMVALVQGLKRSRATAAACRG